MFRRCSGRDVDRGRDCRRSQCRLSRRRFVQTVGIGAGVALGSSVSNIWGRGRENSLCSVIEQEAAGGRARRRLPRQQREPGRTRQGRPRHAADAARRRRQAGPLLEPDRAIWSTAICAHVRQAERQEREHPAERRLDGNPPRRDPGVHVEDQGARRHHSDLRGMRGLRRAARQPGAAASSSTPSSRSTSTPYLAASKGAGLVFYCNPNNPTVDLRRRQGDARLPRRS